MLSTTIRAPSGSHVNPSFVKLFAVIVRAVSSTVTSSSWLAGAVYVYVSPVSNPDSSRAFSASVNLSVYAFATSSPAVTVSFPPAVTGRSTTAARHSVTVLSAMTSASTNASRRFPVRSCFCIELHTPIFADTYYSKASTLTDANTLLKTKNKKTAADIVRPGSFLPHCHSPPQSRSALSSIYRQFARFSVCTPSPVFPRIAKYHLLSHIIHETQSHFNLISFILNL